MEDNRFRAPTPHHICVVTETYPPEINGVAITLSRLVSGLRALGNRVSVVHPKQRSQTASLEKEPADIQIRGLPLPGYSGLQFGVPCGRRLKKTWNHNSPDAVYVATEGPLGWSAVRAAKRLGIPVLTGFHTNFHSYCKHYRVGWLQKAALGYLRWFHNQTERTLVTNEELRERLQHAGFNNVSILERGVDAEQFAPRYRSAALRREWGLTDEDLALIYVGRIAAEKNLNVAIDAYHAIKRFNQRCKFVLVGDGPLRSSLQRKHSDLIFAGMRSGDDLGRHYASGDVFLFPSETETFGNVTLEAMASGLAVVAYNYACARLHIVDGETGASVSFGDSGAFVNAACALARDPQAIKRIRRQAREYVTYLSWSRVVEKFQALLLNAGSKSSIENDGVSENRNSPLSPITRRRLAV
jgi:glycosyltransferase involved in cell wall biosynthesis